MEILLIKLRRINSKMAMMEEVNIYFLIQRAPIAEMEQRSIY